MSQTCPLCDISGAQPMDAPQILLILICGDSRDRDAAAQDCGAENGSAHVPADGVLII